MPKQDRRVTMTITELVEKAHENARKKGFWEDWDLPTHEPMSEYGEYHWRNSAISTRLMLIVSEVSEALETLRNGDEDHFPEELADIAIRLGDLCGGLGIDLEKEIIKKVDKNKDRPYKHGKAF